NAEFRLLWADRVQKQFFNDGALTPAAGSARYQEEAARIDKAIVAESARWGDWRRDARSDPSAILYTRNGSWLTEQNRLLNSYFPQRTANVLQQFRKAGLYPSIDAPAIRQHGGTFVSTAQFTIDRPTGQGTIYYTLDGSDPRLPGGALSPNALIYTAAITLTRSTCVKARILDAGTWSALDEAAFLIGAAPSLRITELMYHPAPPPDSSPYSADDFEFIELQNTGLASLDLAGYTFTNGIHFIFPDGARIDPAERIVLVRNRAAFQNRYGTGIPIAGEYLGALDNAGARITLTTNLGQVIEDFTYKDGWYAIADGDGYSLVARDPDATDTILSSKDGWRPSNPLNGAPAVADPGLAPGTIVINELMSHPSADQGDWLELYNNSDAPVDLSGWFLSDSDEDLTKYRLLAGTMIGPHAYLVFTQAQHFGNVSNPGCRVPFGFQEHTGDQAYLTSSDGQGNLGGYRESVDFGAADRDASFGLHIKSTGGSDFVAQSTPTPGQANADPLVGPVVINEIMYNPASGDVEFVELKNLTSVNLPLYDPLHPANLWAFVDGIHYTFPVGASIPAAGYALVVGIDPQTFRSQYAIPANVPVFGPFTGLLDNAGDTLELAKPGSPEGDGYVPIVTVERIKYNNQAPWPIASDGQGSSLARIDPTAYGNEAGNWTAEVVGGSPGRANSDKTPPAVQILPATPDPRETAVDSIVIRFSEPITGLDLADLILTRNGQALVWPASVSLISTDAQDWILRGLSSLTWCEGRYTLSLIANASGIADLSGNALPSAATESFTINATTLRGSGGDQFYLRTRNSSLEVFRNAQPDSSTPTFIAPLNELSLLDLDGGTYHIASDLAGLRLRIASSNPLEATLLLLDSTQHLSSLTLNGPVQMRLSTGNPIVLHISALSLDAQATLDLADNALILQSSPQRRIADLAQLSNWIKSACSSDGRWSGTGLTSSAAQANNLTGLAIMLNDENGTPILTRFAGQSVTENDILVKYTWNGDVDLNGIVDGDDYFLVDSGFITQQDQYRNGDLNLNGVVDGDDYFLIDSAFIAQTGILATRDPSRALSNPHTSIAPRSPLANRAMPFSAQPLVNFPVTTMSTLAQLFSTKPLL
ncbi:MAG: lamin tail domain-containing protein, partial [Bacillota bacterium]